MDENPKPPAKWNVVGLLLTAVCAGFVLWMAFTVAVLGWVYFVRGHFD